MISQELGQVVDAIEVEHVSDRLSIPYRVLFTLIGVQPEQAKTIIPFLHKDREYLSIPGKIQRITDLGGGLRNISDPGRIPEETAIYQETLPEIPLIPLDLRMGIPEHFSEQFGRADLFIVNHGIILSRLNAQDSTATQYLESIQHATHDGSLIMIIHDADDTLSIPDEMAKRIGAESIDDALSDSQVQALNRLGLRRRRIIKQHPDGLPHLGDFIQLPESNRNSAIYLYRKIVL